MTISLKNLRFAYSSAPEQPVLDIPLWSVATGERVFVHGDSGGGKSTLLNLLSGMLVPGSGEVSILEQRIDNMSLRQRNQFRANHVGYVFQHFNLIPYLNAVENVALATHFCKPALKHAQQDIVELLTTLNIAPEQWEKPASQLSIGQQQRVAIARALINKPELLIADEPTSSLDQRNRDNFMSVLMSLVEEHNTTLVFVSHDMAMSTYFDRKDALAEISLVGRGA